MCRSSPVISSILPLIVHNQSLPSTAVRRPSPMSSSIASCWPQHLHLPPPAAHSKKDNRDSGRMEERKKERKVEKKEIGGEKKVLEEERNKEKQSLQFQRLEKEVRGKNEREKQRRRKRKRKKSKLLPHWHPHQLLPAIYISNWLNGTIECFLILR
ncbi:unnamed protein product [Cuscuta europaea]|uniref:Uncharacterized protein n=1 Tax=Cuscuta europaea TaxID=41803 RepID=A0A9P0Z4V4_CUSEU|nr:unnamed protein product [Cuscuta europaea]